MGLQMLEHTKDDDGDMPSNTILAREIAHEKKHMETRLEQLVAEVSEERTQMSSRFEFKQD